MYINFQTRRLDTLVVACYSLIETIIALLPEIRFSLAQLAPILPNFNKFFYKSKLFSFNHY